jgi:hypothetical protein
MPARHRGVLTALREQLTFDEFWLRVLLTQPRTKTASFIAREGGVGLVAGAFCSGYKIPFNLTCFWLLPRVYATRFVLGSVVTNWPQRGPGRQLRAVPGNYTGVLASRRSGV